jgi:hypothetical protein
VIDLAVTIASVRVGFPVSEEGERLVAQDKKHGADFQACFPIVRQAADQQDRRCHETDRHKGAANPLGIAGTGSTVK